MASTASKSVLSRALSVLDAFDEDHRALSLSDISRRAELPLATAHRHVQDLEQWEALHRRGDGAYEIGARIRRLASLHGPRAVLVEAAASTLHDVAGRSGHAILLATVDAFGGDILMTVVGAKTALPLPLPSAVPLKQLPPPCSSEDAGRAARVRPICLPDDAVAGRHLLIAPIELPDGTRPAVLMAVVDGTPPTMLPRLLAGAAGVIGMRLEREMPHA